MAGPPGLGSLQEVVSAAEGISFLDTSVSATLSCHLIWRSLQRVRDQVKVSVLDRRGLACVEEGGEDHLKAELQLGPLTESSKSGAANPVVDLIVYFTARVAV